MKKYIGLLIILPILLIPVVGLGIVTAGKNDLQEMIPEEFWYITVKDLEDLNEKFASSEYLYLGINQVTAVFPQEYIDFYYLLDDVLPDWVFDKDKPLLSAVDDLINFFILWIIIEISIITLFVIIKHQTKRKKSIFSINW